MISTKGRYALRLMIDLAEQPAEEYIPLKDIANRQELSKKYLEIIIKDLVRAGFVTGHSGKGGGYRLCRKPEEYTIREILEQMEGSLAAVHCLSEGADSCPRAAICKTLPMWQEFSELTYSFFNNKRLSDLLT